jgi:hypothetical protein
VITFKVTCSVSAISRMMLGRYSNGLRAGRSGSDSRQRQETFLYSGSTPAPGPSQSLIQWVPGTFSAGVKRSWREADDSPPFSAEIKNGGAIPLFLYTSSWRGA